MSKEQPSALLAHSSPSMELREWAVRILSGDTLEEKLFAPERLTDLNPGASRVWDLPTRPPGMGLNKRTKEEKLPPFQEHCHPDKRAICLHRFAGHELLAVEIMAYALLRFPEASKSFRMGVAHTLKEEQEHVKLYSARLKDFGIKFGDLPLYRHFWIHTPYLTSPLAYIATLSLTFEMANLDFAPMYGESFAKQGDFQSAALMERIFSDEITHVAFGWRWLKKLKSPALSEWEAWQEARAPLLSPKRAKGFLFHETPRKKSGISEEWLQKLKNA
ncbi:MAG: DUF455 family protein [Simkania negevensis]|nr:DUF455 family protein [Simkania negevensis]